MKLDLAPLIRFMSHLPKNGDVELALLKCHLLVEEVITELIKRSIARPEYLPNAKLSFAQKIWLARSLSKLEIDDWAWTALKRLNQARNELAHGLSTEQINIKLDEFMQVVETGTEPPPPDVLGGAFGRFQWAAFKVFTLFSAHAHFDPTASGLRIPTLLTDGAEHIVPADRPQAGGR